MFMAKRKQKWFTKVRSSYIPCSREGWLLYIPYIALLGLVYWLAMSQFGYSVTALAVVLAGWAAVAAGMTYIASNSS